MLFGLASCLLFLFEIQKRNVSRKGISAPMHVSIMSYVGRVQFTFTDLEAFKCMVAGDKCTSKIYMSNGGIADGTAG